MSINDGWFIVYLFQINPYIKSQILWLNNVEYIIYDIWLIHNIGGFPNIIAHMGFPNITPGSPVASTARPGNGGGFSEATGARTSRSARREWWPSGPPWFLLDPWKTWGWWTSPETGNKSTKLVIYDVSLKFIEYEWCAWMKKLNLFDGWTCWA